MSAPTSRLRVIHAVTGIAVGLSGILMVAIGGGEIGAGIVAAFILQGLTIVVVPALFFDRTLGGPVEGVREVIQATRNDGDLSRRVDVTPASSIAPLAGAINELFASFQGIISRVVFNSHQLAQAAEKLIDEARATTEASSQQNTAALSAAGAVAEMTSGVKNAAERANETARIAESASEYSRQGRTIVQEAATEIERIARSVEESAQVVSALSERSSQIDGIARVIREIADQTNLLALNAAIEAARAGEQGRGFAVVADEVRKLAERTSAATGEISSVIGAIQTETRSAITAIRQGTDQARNGAALARQAADALQRIDDGAQQTLGMSADIAQTMRTLSDSSDRISALVTNIIDMADRNAGCSNNTLAQANQLEYLAMNLEEIGVVFKLGQAGEDAGRIHDRMPQVVQAAARNIALSFEEAVDSGRVTLDALFDENYSPIPNTRPQKFHSRYDELCDQILPATQEPLLEANREAVYAIACDRRGYVPTHNKRFCQPLTGDEARDKLTNRTKRMFDDTVGKRCGTHELPFLLQTYRRDTGEIMHDISAPIFVKGRHWGGFRIGYRTE